MIITDLRIHRFELGSSYRENVAYRKNVAYAIQKTPTKQQFRWSDQIAFPRYQES